MKVKIKKKFLVLSVMLFSLMSGNVLADEPGKDHPLVSRYPGSRMTFYENKKFSEFYILKSPSTSIEIDDIKKCEKIKLEGEVTKIQYSFPKERSAYEVFKNYEMAFKKAGFKILCILKSKDVRDFLVKENGFSGNIISHTSEKPNDHFYISAKMPNGQAYVSVYVGEGYMGRPGIIALGIVELKTMETGLVTAKDIEEDIRTKGHVAIYGIHFDFDRADIKPESEPVLKEIAKFLKNNPEVKLFVVGHTDNIGTLQYNMELSRKRAEAVVRELVEKYGINKERLKAFGVGSLAPVASNKTEEGRTLNRRVELVEQ